MCPINITPVMFFPLNLTFWFYIMFKDILIFIIPYFFLFFFFCSFFFSACRCARNCVLAYRELRAWHILSVLFYPLHVLPVLLDFASNYPFCIFKLFPTDIRIVLTVYMPPTWCIYRLYINWSTFNLKL